MFFGYLTHQIYQLRNSRQAFANDAIESALRNCFVGNVYIRKATYIVKRIKVNDFLFFFPFSRKNKGNHFSLIFVKEKS